MTATVFTEAVHPFAYLVSEAGEGGRFSRDAITIAANQTILVGTVLGRSAVIANVTSSAAADAGNTGNGTITLDVTTPVLAAALDGVYRAVCIAVAANGGTFAVFDPVGHEIGRVAVGATFSNQVKFVIADGATDWAAGDAINITVGIEYDGDMTFGALNLSATDGTQNAFAIAGYPVTTASATAQIAATMRASEVRLTDLAWPGGITAIQKAEAIDQLRARGIICR